MFQLSPEEKAEVVANCDHLSNLKFSKTLPYAFTEHRAIMAASVLSTQRAIEASIFVVRARIRFHVISTEGRNLKLTYFQYNKISRYARNDNFGELSDCLLVTHKELALKLSELERKIESHDESIQTIFEAIRFFEYLSLNIRIIACSDPKRSPQWLLLPETLDRKGNFIYKKYTVIYKKYTVVPSG